MLKLLGSHTSPFVRKVRIVLAEKKLEYQLVVTDVFTDPLILASNPLGKIPCLVMEGGEAVFDSRVIVEYLDAMSPVGKLIPTGGRERVEVKTWEALADGVLDACVAARLELHWSGRPKEQQCQAWIERQWERVERALDAMESGLGAAPYCVGNHLTLADLAVGSALGYIDFRNPERQWRDKRPKLQRFYERLAARQSFIDTTPKTA